MTKKVKECKKPEGIGGWLLIPTISLFLRIVLYSILAIYCIVINFMYGFNIVIIILILVFIGISYLIFCLLQLEFRKDKNFPKWIMRLFYVEIIIGLLLSIGDGDYAGTFGVFISLIIWWSYFKKSKRVRNTFIK